MKEVDRLEAALKARRAWREKHARAEARAPKPHECGRVPEPRRIPANPGARAALPDPLIRSSSVETGSCERFVPVAVEHDRQTGRSRFVSPARHVDTPQYRMTPAPDHKTLKWYSHETASYQTLMTEGREPRAVPPSEPKIRSLGSVKINRGRMAEVRLKPLVLNRRPVVRVVTGHDMLITPPRAPRRVESRRARIIRKCREAYEAARF